MLKAYVSYAEFQQDLIDYARFVKKEVREVVVDRAKKILVYVEKFYPPKTQEQGEHATERDIRKTVTIFDDQAFPLLPIKTRDRILFLLHARNYPALRKIFGNLNNLKNYTVMPWSPLLHTSQRDRRGRVNSKQLVITPDYEEVQAYIKLKKDAVQYNRSGWNPSARVLGVAILPQGAKFGDRHGNVISTSLSDPIRPSITMESNSSQIPDAGRIANGAFNSAAKDMKRALEYRLGTRKKTSRGRVSLT